MKKAVILSSLLFIILGTLVFYMYSIFQDSQSWKHLPSSPYSFSVYIPVDRIPDESVYELMREVAEDYKVSVVKKNYQQVENQSVLIYSAVSGNNISFLEGYCQANGSTLPSPNGSLYLSTDTPEETDQLATIYDLFADDHIQIWSLEKWMDDVGDMSGEYIMTSNNPIRQNEIIEFLSLATGMSDEELQQQKYFEISDNSAMLYVFVALFLVNGLLFSLFVVFYALNSSKKIGICKLNGWRNVDIFAVLTKDMFFWTAISTLVIDCALMVFIKGLNREFLISLLQVQLFILFIELVLSSGMMLIISRYRIADMIKNRTRLRFVLVLSGGVRVVLLGVTIAALFFIPKELLNISQELETISNWEKYGQYYVLNHTEIGEDIDSIAGGSHALDESYAALYDSLCDRGAIYALGESHLYSVLLNQSATTLGIDLTQDIYKQELEIVSVNPNYLKVFPIVDESGETILVDEGAEERIILIPASQAGEMESLRDLFRAAYIDDCRSVARFYGAEIPDMDMDSIRVDVRVYQSPIKFFSFNTRLGDGDGYMLNEPIIEVLTKSNMSFFERSAIIASGADSPLKLSEELALGEDMPQILKDVGLDDNNLRYGKLVNWFYDEISRYKDAIYQLTIVLSLAFLVSIVVGYYLNVIFIESNMQRILVKKLLGHRLKERYRNIFLYLFISYALFTATFSVIVGFTWITGILLLFLLAIDLLILIAFLRHIEKKNVLSKIKGG